MSELKQTPQYTESVHQVRSSRDSQQLQGKGRITEAKTRGASEYLIQNMELLNLVEEKEHIIKMKDCRTIHEKTHIIETKEREMQQTQEQLSASMQLVSEFQQRFPQKDKAISDLQHTISVQEIKIQQLQQQNKSDRVQPQLQSFTTDVTTAAIRAPTDISEMTWREVKNTPEIMYREAAIVTAYFRPFRSQKVYSLLDEEQWTRLPDNPYMRGLA